MSMPELADSALRARLRAAAQRGRADEVAWLAADPMSAWPDRGAAAAALLDTRVLGPEHGPDVFEALTRDLLVQGDVSGASQAAMAVAHLSAAPEAALARIDTWRALCGVPQSRFWGETDDGAEGASLRDEVVARAWVTPPNARGELVAYVEFAPRAPAEGDEAVRSAVVVGIAAGNIDVFGSALTLVHESELVDYRDRALAGGGVEAPATELGATGSDPRTALLVALQRDPAGIEGPLPTLVEAQALMRRPESIAGWILTAKDLGGCDPDGPIERLVAQLDQAQLAARVAWAARAMGRWWRWAGDRAAAASFEALAADATRDWRASILLRALILCSRSRVALPPERAPKVSIGLRFARVERTSAPSYVAAMAEAFAASPEGRARAAEGSKLSWARLAVLYGLHDEGVTPLAWTPDTCKALLFGTFAYQATAIGSDAPAIVADVLAFVAFLEARWELPNAAALRRTLATPGVADDLALALDDRSSWHPAKAVMVQARLAGVDPRKMAGHLQSLGSDGLFWDGPPGISDPGTPSAPAATPRRRPAPRRGRRGGPRA